MNLNDGTVYNNSVLITVEEKPIITGGVAFYLIPLGSPGTHTARHSHIRLYYLYSDNYEKEFKAQKLALSFKQGPIMFKVGDSYNSATIPVQWTGTASVAPIMSTAVQNVIKDSQGDITFLKPALIDRSRFKYQFQTNPSKGPAEVVALLGMAIGSALPENSPLPQMPTIKFKPADLCLLSLEGAPNVLRMSVHGLGVGCSGIAQRTMNGDHGNA